MRGVLPLLLLLLAACSPAPAPLISGAAHPPMWLAERDGTRLYLLGAVHALPSGVDWQDARVRAAIAGSNRLLLELAPDELARAAPIAERMARDEPVPSLTARIGSAAAAQLADYTGIDEGDADRQESWALSLLLGNARAQAWGLSGDNGVETVLRAKFRADGKPISGLETAQDQLRAFDDIDPARQARALTLSLAEGDSARAHTVALLRAWATGNDGELGRIAAADLARTPWIIEPLVTRRNRAWASALAGMRGTILVAVGSGHLVGQDNLPDLLAAQGFRVRALPAR